MPNLTASIPHQLGRAEAKRRIQEQLGLVRQQSGAMLTNLNESWNGDRMDFTASAMGQTISGHLTVDEQALHLEVVLPWLLRVMSGSIKQRIEQDVRRLLTDSSNTA